jgi:hypothetical protein
MESTIDDNHTRVQLSGELESNGIRYPNLYHQSYNPASLLLFNVAQCGLFVLRSIKQHHTATTRFSSSNGFEIGFMRTAFLPCTNPTIYSIGEIAIRMIQCIRYFAGEITRLDIYVSIQPARSVLCKSFYSPLHLAAQMNTWKT